MNSDDPETGLKIANGLVLPPAIVGMRMPVFAEPGAGKSVFLAVLMEELWRLRLQFVAIDPLGTGWGIKTSADGKTAGIAVPYLGGTGRYADAPLRPDGGAIVARALAKTGTSMMLNLAPFSRSDQNRFVADLWNELLRIAGDRHEAGQPLSLLNLVDEAAFFMPETARSAEQARAQDAGERVARQGRSLGLGFVTPTQRGQSLDKDVVGTWEIFVLLRLTDKRAIDAAIKEFEHVVGAKLALEIRATLPHLANGEAWIVAPRALGFTRRVHLRMRHTYDSTKTPIPGERRHAPTSLAQADLSALRDALAAPLDSYVGEADAAATLDSPTPTHFRALRSENQLLRKKLAAQSPPEPPRRIEVPILTDADRGLLANTAQIVSGAVEQLRVLARALNDLGARLSVSSAGAPAGSPRPLPRPTAGASTTQPQPPVPTAFSAAAATATRQTSARNAAGGSISGGKLKAGQVRMLMQLARCGGSLSKMQLATLADINRTSGTFSDYLRMLRDLGYVSDDASIVVINAAGSAAVGEAIRTSPPTVAEIVAIYSAKLKAGERRMLDLLVASHPQTLTKTELARRASINRESGTFSDYLRRLRVNGLVDVTPRTARANDTLFIGTANDG